MSFLVSILILGFLILVHEAGHFLVARRMGVRVLRFSIGFGPRLLTWQRHGTEYALSLVPLGGYVKMAGEQRSEYTHQPWEYLSKPIGTRAAIIVAGPLVNYLVAVATLWLVFVIGYPELSPAIGTLLEDMPAQAAGFQPGDRVVAIGGQSVRTWDELTKIVHRSAGLPLDVEIEREGARQHLRVVPQAKDHRDLYGRTRPVGLIGVAPSGDMTVTRVGPLEAVRRTFLKQAEWCASIGLAFWSMATGRLSMRESITGPIGIIILTSEAVHLGFAWVLSLVSLFSLSLAVFNVFPIPILDGGHLFFLALEKLRGTPVSLSVQERATQVSLVVLVALVIIVSVNDVQNFRLVDRILEWVR